MGRARFEPEHLRYALNMLAPLEKTVESLLSINVNEHTERKNNLTYLSWAWAWAKVLEIDPQATWAPRLFSTNGEARPYMSINGTCMVMVNVTIKGLERSCMLPVMDHRNKAIKDPDAFAVNTAIMRCMTKAVSMHGLGLYIYAGEDLPQADAEAPAEKPKRGQSTLQAAADDNPIPADEKPYLDELAMDMTEAFQSGGAEAAYELMEEKGLENAQKLYLSTRLASNVRNGVKKVSIERRAVAA